MMRWKTNFKERQTFLDLLTQGMTILVCGCFCGGESGKPETRIMRDAYH